MTNIVGITNMVWMVVTGTVPVAVQTFDEAHYWTESTYFFIAGFGDGFPLAILLATVWAIVAALRRNRNYSPD